MLILFCFFPSLFSLPGVYSVDVIADSPATTSVYEYDTTLKTETRCYKRQCRKIRRDGVGTWWFHRRCSLWFIFVRKKQTLIFLGYLDFLKFFFFFGMQWNLIQTGIFPTTKKDKQLYVIMSFSNKIDTVLLMTEEAIDMWHLHI